MSDEFEKEPLTKGEVIENAVNEFREQLGFYDRGLAVVEGDKAGAAAYTRVQDKVNAGDGELQIGEYGVLRAMGKFADKVATKDFAEFNALVSKDFEALRENLTQGSKESEALEIDQLVERFSAQLEAATNASEAVTPQDIQSAKELALKP